MNRYPIWLALCATISFGCNEHESHEAHSTESGHIEHAGHDEHEGHEDSAGRHDNHDHDDHGEGSDLDRPVDELFAASCEHGIKTHTCDECRYEVGVVRAPKNLFEGGLLHTAKPSRKAIGVPLQLTGEVQFDQRRVAHVSTQAEGIIREVHVNLGDQVKRGARLVEIESVAVGEAQAAYLEARGMLELAQRNAKRKTELRREGISSEKGLLEAEQDLEVARIRAETALGTLVRLGMSESSAKALSRGAANGRLALRSPAAGTVLEIHAVAGEVARSEASLVTVGDNSAVWVWADLYERDIAVVSKHQKENPLDATVAVKAFPDRAFPGTVDFISPAMSKTSRTVKVRVAVPNASGDLLAGMFAAVSLFLPGGDEQLTVPRCSILEDEGRSFVFVHHEGDYYVRRPVTPGRSLGDQLEIRRGLTGDETIVTDGAFLMKSDVLRSKMGAGCAD